MNTRATHVPVGDDQRQHLELARQIAGSANHRYDTQMFTVPETITPGVRHIISQRTR